MSKARRADRERPRADSSSASSFLISFWETRHGPFVMIAKRAMDTNPESYKWVCKILVVTKVTDRVRNEDQS